ncbi:MAG: glycosyltransferase family 2 protein [Methanobacteriaceae archaeon]|nr:glycosyltransferase family 2 protein [Methanobacteriaceae archaeon]
MIEEKLEIVIPTYNRAEYLDNTLSQLLNSPFKNCKITIRDNASPDNTPEICEKYEKLFPNINIIKNRLNIGGNANVIRCYEQSTTEYTWVIADNDSYDFKNCDDFIEAIESEKYDMILCCSPGFPNEDGDSLNDILKNNNAKNNYLENNSHELVEILKKYYFLSMAFISTTIFRTELLTTDCFLVGYDYISNSYPHYAFIVKSLEENFMTYKTKTDMIHMEKNPDDWEIEKFNWVIRWIDSGLLVKDKKFQNYAIQFFEGSPLKIATGMLIVAKANNENNLKQEIMRLFSTFLQLKGWFKGSLYNIVILLTYLIPKKICKVIYSKHESKKLD